MLTYKPNLINLLFSKNNRDYNYFFNGKNLGVLDQYKTLKQIPRGYLLLAIGPISTENNYTTPREILYSKISEKNILYLSNYIKNVFFSEGTINLYNDYEKINIVSTKNNINNNLHK